LLCQLQARCWLLLGLQLQHLLQCQQPLRHHVAGWLPCCCWRLLRAAIQVLLLLLLLGHLLVHCQLPLQLLASCCHACRLMLQQPPAACSPWRQQPQQQQQQQQSHLLHAALLLRPCQHGPLLQPCCLASQQRCLAYLAAASLGLPGRQLPHRFAAAAAAAVQRSGERHQLPEQQHQLLVKPQEQHGPPCWQQQLWRYVQQQQQPHCLAAHAALDVRAPLPLPLLVHQLAAVAAAAPCGACVLRRLAVQSEQQQLLHHQSVAVQWLQNACRDARGQLRCWQRLAQVLQLQG
jgi:hypothetical protein